MVRTSKQGAQRDLLHHVRRVAGARRVESRDISRGRGVCAPRLQPVGEGDQVLPAGCDRTTSRHCHRVISPSRSLATCGRGLLWARHSGGRFQYQGGANGARLSHPGPTNSLALPDLAFIPCLDLRPFRFFVRSA